MILVINRGMSFGVMGDIKMTMIWGTMVIRRFMFMH